MYAEFIGPCIGGVVLLILIAVVALIIPCANVILLFLFGPALFAGPAYAAMRCLRGDRWEFNDFFGGFERWGSLWVANFLTMLTVILLYVGFAVATVAVVGTLASMRPRPDPRLQHLERKNN
jgi:hypothetical protein